eukprot:m.354511 g.354511  ORF g.354511 m.354511 type:complete len:437 (-) comp17039_c0_seq1:1773-3083(-)
MEPGWLKTILVVLIMLYSQAIMCLWVVNTELSGSVFSWAALDDAIDCLTFSGRFSITAIPWKVWSYMLWFIAFEMGLLVLIPGPTVQGPPSPVGYRPTYKDNGIACWILTMGAIISWLLVAPQETVVDVFEMIGPLQVALNYFALFVVSLVFLKARLAPDVEPQGRVLQTSFPIIDFYVGQDLHPTLFGIPLKQIINCRIGMMLWGSIVAVCAMYSYRTDEGNGITPATVGGFLLIMYLTKFFWWEGGYFATMDITHDRCGYYLFWGCLSYVPCLYTAPFIYLASNPTDLLGLSQTSMIIAAVVGVTAIYINYDTDMQRSRVRANPTAPVWGKPPTFIKATYKTTDGKTRENLLITCGYYGLARHMNYLFELTATFIWTCPGGLSLGVGPFAYFLFLFVLLVHRERRDDERCLRKYGKAWEEYTALVPYRILPYVY